MVDIRSNRSLNASSIDQLLGQMADDQARAFEAGDLAAFMHWFDLDLVSNYYMRRWFTGYAVKVAVPQKCRVQIQKVEFHAPDEIACQFVFHLSYAAFEEETVYFENLVRRCLEPGNEGGWRISESSVELAQKAWPDQPNEQSFYSPAYGKSGSELSQEPCWWEGELADLARSSRDYLKPSLYARGLAKSTRYRSTHPEIDSAVLIANMASTRACRLAFSLGTTDPALYLQRLRDYGQQLMVGKNYEALRQANRSYFPAKELSLQTLYSLDEVFAFRDRSPDHPVEVNCPEITAFYVSLLRLLGLHPWDSFVLIQPFHYLSFLQLARGYYILSGHEIIPMSQRRLYGDTEVTRLVSPAFYLDQSGLSNMPTELVHQLQDLLHRCIPIFALPERNKDSDSLPLQAESFASLQTCATPEQLSGMIRQQMFHLSRCYPSSPFTWAKYAYQTLLVAQPQTYLAWSLKAPECKAFAQEQGNFESALGWMQHELSDGSIFEEPDRIMTADQVVRHQRGSARDRAIFLYTIARLLERARGGGVVLTNSRSYAVLSDMQGQVIYDCSSLQEVTAIEGKILLAFDEQESFDPLRDRQSTKPDWLAGCA